MKKLFFYFVFFISFSVYSQDKIVFKDKRDTVYCKIDKITESIIFYHENKENKSDYIRNVSWHSEIKTTTPTPLVSTVSAKKDNTVQNQQVNNSPSVINTVQTQIAEQNEAVFDAYKNGNTPSRIERRLSKISDVNIKNKDGSSPLELTVGWSNWSINEIQKATSNKTWTISVRNQMIQLYEGFHERYNGIMELLISKGADVNSKNNSGNTPLLVAISGGNKEMVSLLISKGADVNSMNNLGKTPLVLAKNLGKTDIAELLTTNGAVDKVSQPLSNSKTKDTQSSDFSSQSKAPSNLDSLTRGSGDPLKGLNVSKSKEITSGTYYALIIGVDKYSGQWTELHNAVHDAQSIEKTLTEKYRIDKFYTLYDEQATRSAIMNILENLVNTLKEDDNVMIYFSGHGEFKKTMNKGYWVPYDAKTNAVSDLISNNDIQTFLASIQTKHTLLISDACFSGDIFRGTTVSIPFEESDKYYSKVYNKNSRQAMTSGGIEPVMDGGKDGHSIFSYFLLKSLNGNDKKYFDVGQLYNDIKIAVINNSNQTPLLNPIKDTGDEGGQFIFIKK
jgi:hypothetical protein